jgi:hypothetical protein
VSDAPKSEKGWLTGWQKGLLFVVATAPIGFAIYAFVFMAQSEVAFDEASCPYGEPEVREVRSGVSVREDRRTCQEGVEEHRWVLLRTGREPLELGRRRLEARLYEGYSWAATEPEGRVRVEIHNPGQDPRVFREPAPDAGM